MIEQYKIWRYEYERRKGDHDDIDMTMIMILDDLCYWVIMVRVGSREVEDVGKTRSYRLQNYIEVLR